MAVTEVNPVQAKPKKSALDIFAQTTGILSSLLPTVSNIKNSLTKPTEVKK